MRVGEAVFKAIADFSAVRREAAQTSTALGGTETAAGKAGTKSGNGFVNGMKMAMKGVGAVGAVASAVVGGISLAKGWDRLSTIEDVTKRMTVQLGDATSAAEFMNSVLGVVSGTPFNLDQFASAGASMVSFGVDAKDVPKYLTAIGEAAAGMGKDAPDAANRLSEAFGKATIEGKVTNDTLDRMNSVGVNGLKILANHFGVTTDEAKKMVTDGTIPAEEGLNALSEGIMNGSDGIAGSTNALKGTMAGLRDSMSGAKGGFNAAIARFGASVLGPFQGLITKGLQSASEVIDGFGGMINKGLLAIVNSPAGQALVAWAQDLPDRIKANFANASTFLKPVFDEITGSFTALVFAFQEGGKDITSGGLAGVFEGIGLAARVFWDAIQPLREIKFTADGGPLSALGDILFGLGITIGEMLPNLALIATALGEATAKVSAVVWTIFLTVLESVARIAESVLVPALELIATYMEENESVVTALVGGYAAFGAAQQALDWASEIIGLVQSGIAWVQNAIAVGKATWAKAKDIGVTIQLMAMYAKDTAIKVANTVVTWASVAASKAMALAQALTSAATYRAAAAWIASRAVMVAGAVATGAVTAAQWLLNAALSANPIGLIIMLIAALVAAFVLLWQNNEGFRNFFISMWEGIKTAAGAVADWFTGVLVPAFIAAVDWIVEAWGNIVQWFTDLWASIVTSVQIFILAFQIAWGQVVTFLSDVWASLVAGVTAFVEGFVAVFQSIVTFLQPVLDVFVAAWNMWMAIIEFIVTLVVFLVMSVVMWFVNMATQIWTSMQMAWAYIVAVWNSIVAFVMAVVTVMVAMVVAKWNEIKDQISLILTAVWLVISSIWNRIVAFVTTVATVVWQIVSSKFNEIRNSVSNALNAVWAVVSSIWNRVSSFIAGVATAIWTIVSAKFSQIWSTISSYLNLVWAVVSSIWNQISSYISTVAQVIWAVVSGKFNEIWAAVSGAMSSISSTVSNMWSLIVTSVQIAAQQIWDAVTTKFNEVVSWLGGVGASMLGALGDLGGLLWSAGTSIISGLLGGLKSMMGNVESFFKGLTAMIPDWKGPADYDAVMLENAGELILGGFIRGLESKYGDVEDSLTGFTNGLAMEPEIPINPSFNGDGFDPGRMLAGFSPSYTGVADTHSMTSRNIVNDKPGDTFLVDKIEVNNPEPEKASVSLPKAVRELATVGVRTA